MPFCVHSRIQINWLPELHSWKLYPIVTPLVKRTVNFQVLKIIYVVHQAEYRSYKLLQMLHTVSAHQRLGNLVHPSLISQCIINFKCFPSFCTTTNCNQMFCMQSGAQLRQNCHHTKLLFCTNACTDFLSWSMNGLRKIPNVCVFTESITDWC